MYRGSFFLPRVRVPIFVKELGLGSGWVCGVWGLGVPGLEFKGLEFKASGFRV